MFSKAKRFEPIVPDKTQIKKPENETQKPVTKLPVTGPHKPAAVRSKPASNPVKTSSDAQSQCSSVKSVRSFVTPKPVKSLSRAAPSSLKKPCHTSFKNVNKPKTTESAVPDDIMKAQEVEIRNKDHTIREYNKQIEELKNEIACLNQQLKNASVNMEKVDILGKELSEITLDDAKVEEQRYPVEGNNHDTTIEDLKNKISKLEHQCQSLEEEVSSKQVELSSLEELITIRDSLCKDLQDKLSNMETCLDETRQRLEMVKGHHALALDANESIRREYKAELETLKLKFEEEKQNIIAKCKADQENVTAKYNNLLESVQNQLIKEKNEIVDELQQQLITKDIEMKAKLEQINEATHEKLRICEIQFEERSRTLQGHWSQQLKEIQDLEKDMKDLKYSLSFTEEQNLILNREIKSLKNETEMLKAEKSNLIKESNKLKEESKKKFIDFENEINKLTVTVDKVTKEKNKFEMSLSVTRDIVQVLTMRLRESDSELEHLESKVLSLTHSKEVLENELTGYKNTLNNTVLECNDYKEALVNILKSKAALAKEHNRIMEHNVSLIESLQHVEQEAYRELGSIKNELIEDVELIKKESNSQMKTLREEVEKKRMLCELAADHAGQATAAAEQSRAMLAQAAAEIARMETDNHRLQQQIQDQQSLVVELSLLRQENEELTMTVAKQSSILDKMKKEAEHVQLKPKSPSMIRKTHKSGKENLQIISPLRERNH